MQYVWEYGEEVHTECVFVGKSERIRTRCRQEEILKW
jgi:hypothetical protein